MEGEAGALTRIKQDQSIRANQVDTTSTRFRTQEEDELFPVGVVELVDEFLSLVRLHRSVESKEIVSRKTK